MNTTDHDLQHFECILSSFEEIYSIWRDKLCPERISKIKPMSSLCWQLPNEIIKDNSIFERYSPTFWVVKDNEKIIGVNSGFKTSDKVYRSRGLYVDIEYRKQGISQILLRQTILQGKKEECHWIWSMPRKTALPVYQKIGFKKRGKWLKEGVEFEPRCLTTRQIIYK